MYEDLEKWLEVKFKSLESDIGDLKKEQEKLSRILTEGNGHQPLKTEVALNTNFREEFKAKVRNLAHARYAFGGAVLALLVSVVLQFVR